MDRKTIGKWTTRWDKEANLKPHLNRYWLNSPDKNTKEFISQIRTVNNLYLQAPELHQKGIHIMSTDEKTGIQALERLCETHSALAGSNKSKELREHNYKRHGTLCLIANFEVATGKIVSSTSHWEGDGTKSFVPSNPA